MAVRKPNSLIILGSLLLFTLSACSSSPSPNPLESMSYPPLPSRRTQQDVEGYYLPRNGLSVEYSGTEISEEKMRNDLRAVRDFGGYFLRVGIPWNEIEISPSKYLWGKWDLLFVLAEEYHVTLLPYVTHMPVWAIEQKNPTRFASFMKEIARRYRGKVPSWELWNAPDQKSNWFGSAEEFMQIISLAVAAVREIDSNVKVVLGSMRDPIRNPFLKTLLDQSGFGELFDVIGISGNSVDPLALHRIKKLIASKAPGRDLWWTMLSDSVDPWKSQLLLASTEAFSLFSWSTGKETNYESLRTLNQILDRPYRRITSKIQIDKRKHSSLQVEIFEKQNKEWFISAWLNLPRNEEVFSLTFPKEVRRIEVDRIQTSGKLISSKRYNHSIPDIRIKSGRIWTALIQPE